MWLIKHALHLLRKKAAFLPATFPFACLHRRSWIESVKVVWWTFIVQCFQSFTSSKFGFDTILIHVLGFCDSTWYNDNFLWIRLWDGVRRCHWEGRYIENSFGVYNPYPKIVRVISRQSLIFFSDVNIRGLRISRLTTYCTKQLQPLEVRSKLNILLT